VLAAFAAVVVITEWRDGGMVDKGSNCGFNRSRSCVYDVSSCILKDDCAITIRPRRRFVTVL
jgi:hypothetical protein